MDNDDRIAGAATAPRPPTLRIGRALAVLGLTAFVLMAWMMVTTSGLHVFVRDTGAKELGTGRLEADDRTLVLSYLTNSASQGMGRACWTGARFVVDVRSDRIVVTHHGQKHLIDMGGGDCTMAGTQATAVVDLGEAAAGRPFIDGATGEVAAILEADRMLPAPDPQDGWTDARGFRLLERSWRRRRPDGSVDDLHLDEVPIGSDGPGSTAIAGADVAVRGRSGLGTVRDGEAWLRWEEEGVVRTLRGSRTPPGAEHPDAWTQEGLVALAEDLGR